MSISFSNLEKVLTYLPMLLQGLEVTVLLSLMTVLFGFVIAFTLVSLLGLAFINYHGSHSSLTRTICRSSCAFR